MRPDRIIVGEVRGAEALDMLQAMNTGHDGSLSTGHANSAEDMLSRLENDGAAGRGGPSAESYPAADIQCGGYHDPSVPPARPQPQKR